MPAVPVALLLAAAGGEPAELTGLAGWAADITDALGAAGVGALVALETIFPPLPSELFLPLAGFLAARGDLGLVAVITFATVGSVVGSLVLYALAAALGRRRLALILERVPLVGVGDLERGEEWFARHGRKAVLLGRLVPLVRSAISLPAGLERMPLPTFVVLTALGSAVWNTALIMLGYVLGDRWQDVGDYSDVINYAVVAVIVLVIGVWLGRRAREHRRASRA